MPTRFDSADEKAWFANTLLIFLARDYPEAMWTQRLYRRLSLCFGFIAHYDRRGFWAHHFASRGAQADFIAELLAWPCWGDPAHTFCDVERAVQERVRACSILDTYRMLASAETEAAERAMLGRLQSKYDGVAPTRPVDLPVVGVSSKKRPRQGCSAEPRLL